MTYKQVKYIRRTPVELKSFRMAKTAFMREGYEEHTAEQLCWDMLFNHRRAKKGNVFGGSLR